MLGVAKLEAAIQGTTRRSAGTETFSIATFVVPVAVSGPGGSVKWIEGVYGPVIAGGRALVVAWTRLIAGVTPTGRDATSMLGVAKLEAAIQGTTRRSAGTETFSIATFVVPVAVSGPGGSVKWIFTRTFIDAGSLAVVCNPVAGLTPPPAAASREFLGAPAAFWITGELSAPITTGETGRSVINSVAPACLSGQHVALRPYTVMVIGTQIVVRLEAAHIRCRRAAEVAPHDLSILVIVEALAP